jgi:hypothetical protein
MRLRGRGALALVFVGGIGCHTGASRYCRGLQEFEVAYGELCGEPAGGIVEDCAEIMGSACTGADIDLLQQHLDCTDQITVCDEFDAYAACIQGDLDDVTAECQFARDRVFE